MSVSSPYPGIRGKPGQEHDVPPILKVGRSDPFYLEQFKALRAKLEYKVDERKMKLIAITSAIAGEGKTLSSVNLAINLASAGRRKILLIDVDLRKSDLARGLDIEPYPGLREFLGGSGVLKDIVRNTIVPGLYVVPGGKTMADPSPLLAAEKIRYFLGKVREQFDVILLDTPPILPVADTLSLRDQVDGFIFLFRADFTPYTLLRQALEELGEANVIGVVMNGIEPKKQKYYQRYYGKYYQGSKISE
jgi:capsular exopolysaccharide synthesis family protein